MSNRERHIKRIHVIGGMIVFFIMLIFLMVLSLLWGAPISTLCVLLIGILLLGMVRKSRPEIFNALKKEEPTYNQDILAAAGDRAYRHSLSQHSYMMLVGLNKSSHYRVFIDKSPFVIGTEASTDFQIMDPYVSRRHLSIEYDCAKKQRYVTDTSLNGTMLNGVGLTKGQRMLLQQGDILQIGDAMFCVEFVHAEDTD